MLGLLRQVILDVAPLQLLPRGRQRYLVFSLDVNLANNKFRAISRVPNHAIAGPVTVKLFVEPLIITDRFNADIVAAQ